MIMRTPYRVRCSTCGAENVLDMELECVSSYERKMGPELEYLAIFDGICSECEKSITVQIEVWEYPEGFVETYEVTVKGAEKMEEPVFINEF